MKSLPRVEKRRLRAAYAASLDKQERAQREELIKACKKGGFQPNQETFSEFIERLHSTVIRQEQTISTLRSAWEERGEEIARLHTALEAKP